MCSQRDRLALEANLAEEEKAAATHRAHTLNTLLSRDRTEVRAPHLYPACVWRALEASRL